MKEIRALYAGEVSMVDHWLGELLGKLERLNLMDDTMIILTTDHGHLFGEHGMIGKPWSDLGDSNMYQELAHIPLMIYHPNGIAGRRVPFLVQPVDLLPQYWMGSISLYLKVPMVLVCCLMSSTLNTVNRFGRQLFTDVMVKP
jgi:membrane-anchored protein YejM (alkaline phosphatase superfamily)